MNGWVPLFILPFFTTLLNAQIAPSVQWQKCYGGSSYDAISCVQKTVDGNFIIAATSESDDGDVSGNHGGEDCWIFLIDSAGNLIWQQCYGGSKDDWASSIVQTNDGGFVIAGSSSSNDGDVTGNHGLTDFWIFKIDGSGNLEWQKSLGGGFDDFAYSIQQTFDSGFIVIGAAGSSSGDVVGNHGAFDYWVVKLNSTGAIEWQKCLGGSDLDFGYNVRQTPDSGMIVGGYSISLDGDVTMNHGLTDSWIVRLDKTGNLVWEKSLGGEDYDAATDIVVLDDGYIITSIASSLGGNVSGNHGGDGDYWIVKLDESGNIVWQRCFGGSGSDKAFSTIETSDGDFLVVGYSTSEDGDITINKGFSDGWLIRIDTAGNLIWQKSIGGSDFDYTVFLEQMSSESFIIAGETWSNDGDISGNHGSGDCLIIKLGTDSATGIYSFQKSQLILFPNPVQNLLTIDLDNQTTNAIIGVFDLQRRNILLPSTIINNKAQLNTESLPNGFYTLQVTDKYSGKTSVAKFVKQ
ncbi:MAG: T9SS type A sorting domain-containing protein [Chitinophagales bacterium]|nr:T9SS type A sorting domain-containing protein [Chitinophagales bacterium]